MANKEQLRILKQGVEAWNAQRDKWNRNLTALASNQGAPRVDRWAFNFAEADVQVLSGGKFFRIDLRGTNLSKTDLMNALRPNLNGAKLFRADLHGADLHGADLIKANLGKANLEGANLTGANLTGANFREANLEGANLEWANLSEADFRDASLTAANLNEVIFVKTIVLDVDLSGCKNLATIRHAGPSTIDIRTLQRSGRLPLDFLRGVGLPDILIDYLPSLLGQAIQHYTCFISYSSTDDEFARRLHADLQDKGVRCWFAPEDMKIGAKIRDTIDEAIRLRDKVLLVLSKAAIASDWVEDEVDKTFEEERSRGGVVLFPVRLDDSVLETNEAWAAKLRRSRNIGDFRAWKDHDTYQKALDRVLRDLRVETPDVSTG
jgi:uncharacterized protein YjbI with pentapeptide repeats